MALPGLRKHQKFKRLVSMITKMDIAPKWLSESIASGILESLWMSGYETGNPKLGEPVDVELACGWEGQEGSLFFALLTCGGEGNPGFIEPCLDNPNKYQIHDLLENAPKYVKDRARKRHTRESAKQNNNLHQKKSVTDATCADNSANVAESGGNVAKSRPLPDQTRPDRNSPYPQGGDGANQWDPPSDPQMPATANCREKSFRVDPSFDSHLDDFWQKMVSFQRQSEPGAKAMELGVGNRRRELSDLIHEHDEDSVLQVWRWCCLSPRFANARQKWHGFPTFVKNFDTYKEISEKPDAWKAPTESNPRDAPSAPKRPDMMPEIHRMRKEKHERAQQPTTKEPAA